MQRVLNLPLRAPRATLAVMLAITLVFAFFARSIKVDSSIEELLPAHDPDRAYYDDAVATFGSEGIIVVGVFADDVFAPATLAKIGAASERLAALEGVREVLSLTTVKSIEVGDFGLATGRLMRALPKTAEEAAALRAKVLANPLYVKNVVSPDATAAGISVVFEPMSDEEFLARDLDAKIRALAKEIEGPETIAITGIPTLKVNGARFMEQDIAKFMPLSLLLVVVVLAWAFRTARGVLIPLATIVTAVVWTTGTMVLCGSAINMGTLVLNPLLMVIGIASGIHVVSQYYLEVRPGRTPYDVVAAALAHIRMPVAIAAVTTAVGFATLALTSIRAIREFGLYSVFGILVSLVASLTVAPAALVLMPVPEHVRRPSGAANGWIPDLLARVTRVSVRHGRLVLLGVAVVCALSVWGIRQIRVETDYIGFFHPSSSIRTDNQQIASRLAGTQPVYVVIDGEVPQAVTRVEALAAMRELQQFIDAQPGVDKTISLVDYLDLVRRALQPAAAGAQPETQSEIDQILLLVNPADVRAVLSRDQRRANIIVRTTLSGSVDVNAFVERVEAFARERMPRGVVVRATGTLVLLNRSADALVWGQVTGLWQELLVLLGLLSLLFLSLRTGVLALIPNVIPTVVLFGIMGWSGISLNISTSMIAAIAIGIAIDDTIHFLSTFSAELKRTGSQEQAVMNAMASAGQAAFFVTVALAAGFLIVCLSNFQPVQHFGLLSSVTMGVALLTELFLSPALVTTTKIITVWDLLFLKLGPEPQKQIPLFAGLRPFQAKIVALMGRLGSVARDDFIARHGEMKAELYVRAEGTRRGPVGRRHRHPDRATRRRGRRDGPGPPARTLGGRRRRRGHRVPGARQRLPAAHAPALSTDRRHGVLEPEPHSERQARVDDRSACGRASRTAHGVGRRRRGMRTTKLLACGGALAALLVIAVPTTGGAEDGDARALVKRVLDAAPKKPFVAKLTLSTEGGLARELELRHKYVNGAEASYMEVTAPLDVKDTRFLFFDRVEGKDEQFIYLPAMKRSIQVSDDVRKQPFLGSEFYVSDLVSPELDAYTYAFTGDATVGGRACKLVEARPKTPATELYSRVVVAIDPADLVVMRTEFFDPKDKPLKTWTVEKLEKIDTVWTPRTQKMANLQEKGSSTLEIREIKYGSDVPDSVFARTYLTR